jgi:cytochrome P450
MGRKVTSTFRLSDGTVLPKGTYIAIDAQNINYDKSLWSEADTFDGFRFEKMRQQDIRNMHRFQAVTTGVDNLAFGHGSHACPGRFLAVNETKVLLAHLILHYDWKYPKGQARPENFFVDTMVVPNPTIEMLFKARQ